MNFVLSICLIVAGLAMIDGISSKSAFVRILSNTIGIILIQYSGLILLNCGGI